MCDACVHFFGEEFRIFAFVWYFYSVLLYFFEGWFMWYGHWIHFFVSTLLRTNKNSANIIMYVTNRIWNEGLGAFNIARIFVISFGDFWVSYLYLHCPVLYFMFVCQMKWKLCISGYVILMHLFIFCMWWWCDYWLLLLQLLYYSLIVHRVWIFKLYFFFIEVIYLSVTFILIY